MFSNVEECHWKLFEEPSAFYELFFYIFVKMDGAWRRMNASYMEFASVLKSTRNMAIYMLQQSPETLADLREISERTFVDRFVVSITGDFLADTENGECPDPYHVLEDESEVIVAAPAPIAKAKPQDQKQQQSQQQKAQQTPVMAAEALSSAEVVTN